MARDSRKIREVTKLVPPIPPYWTTLNNGDLPCHAIVSTDFRSFGTASFRKKVFFSGVLSSFYGQHSVTAAWATPSPRNILVAQSNFFQEGKFENFEYFLVHLGMVSGFFH